MYEIDTGAPVMVTGATGYVAGWIVKRLLEAGATVHAAVRDPSSEEKLKHLRAIAEASRGTIKFFKADLLTEGSYDAAMAGCRVVFHTASPFFNAVENPQRDLVDPALIGTRNVLESVNRTDSVRRVVLTSSTAAIYGNTSDRPKQGSAFTEEDWNETSSLSLLPYNYSKTVAEREAWKLAEAQQRWTLVAINPALVVGPSLSPQPTSDSFHMISQFGNGTARFGVPDLHLGVVDVQDVAEAHLAAAFISEAKGRHLTSATTSSFLDLAHRLAKKFGKYPLPRTTMPKWVLSLVGPFFDKALSRSFIAKNVGYPLALDNTKSQQALGLRYRDVDDGLHDMFQQLIDTGALEKR